MSERDVPPLKIAQHVTTQHGEVFVRAWFKELTPMQAPDAFCACNLIEWPDEESSQLTPAQKRYNELEDEIMKRTFDPLRDVIAASFVAAATDVLGRANAAASGTRPDEPTERYAGYEPEVRALLDVARAAVRAGEMLPGTVPSTDIIGHLTKAASQWTWSLIEIIMDYEERDRTRTS